MSGLKLQIEKDYEKLLLEFCSYLVSFHDTFFMGMCFIMTHF